MRDLLYPSQNACQFAKRLPVAHKLVAVCQHRLRQAASTLSLTASLSAIGLLLGGISY